MPETLDLFAANPAEAVLQSLLRAYQLHARVTDRFEACGHWDEPAPDAPFAWFHVVEQGICHIRSASLPEPLRMTPGDLVVFPGGAAHHLCSAPTPEDEHPDARVVMICGEFHFDGPAAAALMRALPTAITVRADADNGRLAALAAVLRGEAEAQAFGSRAVLDKLSDALFVIALRDHLRHAPPGNGLLAALTDPRLSAALAAIHNQPGTDWTVQALADKALLSRAAFAQRFNELLGEPPMRYLLRWRMTVALMRLREGHCAVAQVAGELGFETEAAFRRAFKRIHGFGPGLARREARRTT